MLITAAAGGVGSTAVQIATAAGARVLAGTVLPLDQAREAPARVAARHTRGKMARVFGKPG